VADTKQPKAESKSKSKATKIGVERFINSVWGTGMMERLDMLDDFKAKRRVLEPRTLSTLGTKIAVMHGDETCKGNTAICLDYPPDDPTLPAKYEALCQVTIAERMRRKAPPVPHDGEGGLPRWLKVPPGCDPVQVRHVLGDGCRIIVEAKTVSLTRIESALKRRGIRTYHENLGVWLHD